MTFPDLTDFWNYFSQGTKFTLETSTESMKRFSAIVVLLLTILITMFFVVGMVGISYLSHQPSLIVFSRDASSNSFDSFGSTKFQCSGICYCNFATERKSSILPLTQGMKYVLFAVTPVMAWKLAEEYFESECHKIMDSKTCPRESIQSGIENCEPFTLQSQYTLTEEEETEKMKVKDNLKETEFTIRPIGMIHSPWKKPGDVPRGKDARENVIKKAGAIIEVFEEFAEGLLGLKSDDDIFVYFVFDRTQKTDLTTMYHRGKEKKGVFATRIPNRPNKLGMTLVKIQEIKDLMIYVDGIDALDGSPVVDIKIKDGWTIRKKKDERE